MLRNKPSDRINRAMQIISRYGQIDGAHHKQWVIDQVSRALLGDKYNDFVEEQLGETFEGGEREYSYDVGIAP